MKRTDYEILKRGWLCGFLTPSRYRLHRTRCFQTCVYGHYVATDYATLLPNGVLTVYSNLQWDGPSGPTVDTATTMDGSCAHDVLYRMIGDGHLPLAVRWRCDATLFVLMREAGAWRVRAYAYMLAVDYAGGFYIHQEKET